MTKFCALEYDNTRNRPDISEWLTRINCAYEVHIWGDEDRSKPPSWDRLNTLAERLKGKLVALDIEHLAYDLRVTGTKEIESTINHIGYIVDTLHVCDPSLRIGLYDILPIRDYHASTQPEKWGRMWHLANYVIGASMSVPMRDGFRGLVDRVDVLFPSMYTPYPNWSSKWLTFATAYLSQARELGHFQIYPFLYPWNTKTNEMIPGSQWREQLELCYDLADGFVLWIASSQSGWWDDQPDWWLETKSFIADIS